MLVKDNEESLNLPISYEEKVDKLKMSEDYSIASDRICVYRLKECLNPPAEKISWSHEKNVYIEKNSYYGDNNSPEVFSQYKYLIAED